MKLHPEILTDVQLEVLKDLGPLVQEHNFALAGGTALAIYFGHRLSVDFDWFTREGLTDPLRLAQELREANLDLLTERIDRGTLHGSIQGVQVTFLEYRYPLLAPMVDWPELSCSLLSLDDIACMKLSAIGQRGARKDFIDLYALILRHRPLTSLLSLYQQKFAVDDLGHVLYALTYFDDAERERMPEMRWDLSWQKIQDKIREWVREVGI